MSQKKIAFVTDDEETISAHFGRAQKVVIVTVEDGKELEREVRVRSNMSVGGSLDHDHGHTHEHDHSHHHHDHTSKFQIMADCNVLIGRGMGSPARDHALGMGMEVLLTGEHQINDALKLYLSGDLQSDDRRIHHH